MKVRPWAGGEDARQNRHFKTGLQWGSTRAPACAMPRPRGMEAAHSDVESNIVKRPLACLLARHCEWTLSRAAWLKLIVNL
jgi:hypothetical protein